MFKNFIDRLLSRNILYYPGCLSKFMIEDIGQNYKAILTKLGINFIVLPDTELCCGLPALNAGYPNDFQNLVESNVKIFDKHTISKIITSCPECYYVFSNEYPIKVEHVTETILKNISKLELNDFNEERVTYYDSCYLGRHSGIYDAPREILKMLNFNVVELKNNRVNSMCCGAGGGLKANAPKLAGKIAKKLLSQVKTQKLITTCPMCYAHLKDNSEDIEIIELSQVLL